MLLSITTTAITGLTSRPVDMLLNRHHVGGGATEHQTRARPSSRIASTHNRHAGSLSKIEDLGATQT
jgi:hypothetical protein